MIAVGMGDHRALHRAPRIDVEVPGGAVQAFGAGDNKVHGVTGMEGLVSYEVWAKSEVRLILRGRNEEICSREDPALTPALSRGERESTEVSGRGTSTCKI